MKVIYLCAIHSKRQYYCRDVLCGTSILTTEGNFYFSVVKISVYPEV